MPEDDHTIAELHRHEVQEIVFAIPNMGEEKKRELYSMYLNAGYKLSPMLSERLMVAWKV